MLATVLQALAQVVLKLEQSHLLTIWTTIWTSFKRFWNAPKTQEEMIYRNYGKLDDQVLQDGDASFRGINTYLEPCSSETGASD